jgi:hypothetical protein
MAQNEESITDFPVHAFHLVIVEIASKSNVSNMLGASF